MSTRRLPLASNPNAANSPLRANLGAAHGGKRLRSHADLQREETYGQPPPAKRQMVDHGVQRPSVKSPSTQRTTRTVGQRPVGRATATDRASQPPMYKPSEKEVENVRQWQLQTKSRFPKMVVYFESIPDEQRVRLAKQVTQLGGREEKFFSIAITHVVTTRPIPSEKMVQDEIANAEMVSNEQPKTIDPSLLNRTAESTTSVKRKLLFDTAASRKIPAQVHEDAVRKSKPRNADVLFRAREMGKKIWSLDKMQKILDMVMEQDPYKSALLGQGHRSGAMPSNATSKAAEQPNLLQLLQNERVHGPSDRDPTVTTQDLAYFRGPYIYVYDIEEKMKPIMVREYPKVADKTDGEWPQFRVASQGRCPFIDDGSFQPERVRTQAKTKERVTKAVETRAPALEPPQARPSKPVTDKRTLAEMRDTEANRGYLANKTLNPEAVRFHEVTNTNRLLPQKRTRIEFDEENAFMSRAKAPRFVAGEPVASGVQPSKLTSAIRSQMISSTSGVLGGVKAGTSKEIHGLQRKVLQKNSTPAVSQDLSSRRLGEMSHDSNTFIRSTSVCRPAVRGKLDMIDEDDAAAQRAKLRRTESAPAPVQEKQRKRDLKPGYCENCADKFDDFDEHILTRKHRKFAENEKNWAQLDDLLSQLKRRPKYQLDEQEEEGY